MFYSVRSLTIKYVLLRNADECKPYLSRLPYEIPFNSKSNKKQRTLLCSWIVQVQWKTIN